MEIVNCQTDGDDFTIIFVKMANRGAKNILILMRILANWKNALETFDNVLKCPGNMWLAFLKSLGEWSGFMS